ncbi:protein FAM180A-like [Osmerus eperlanus]|uniref:protein FAM180A-like n=1 Tax=Osmerus eperlanus TaxID=29151 RepID=UPI002E138823
MAPWKVVVVTLFYCVMDACTAQRRNKALFPSAVRVKRGMASMVNPTFHNSIQDVNLLFEILLAGLQFGGEAGPFSLPDAELASLRQTRKLEVICEDVIPRKLTEVRRLTSDLSSHLGHLRPEDFERTVLTMVYTAQRISNSTSGHQREVWAESFVSLFQAIKQDLTPE